jgi:protein SERAC1
MGMKTNNIQALVIANNAEQNQSRILDCTRAIAFLGTPHRGSDLANWATLAANLVNTARRTNRAILNTLNPESEVLSILVNDFHPMLKSRERKKAGTISITCYAEELAVSRWGKSFIVS